MVLLPLGEESIASALHNEFNGSKPCGSVECPHCGRLQESTQVYKLKLPCPPILFIGLKRFEGNPNESQSTRYKLADAIEINQSVNLKTCIDEKSQDEIYELHAVAIHKGLQANRGHYTALAKYPSLSEEEDSDIVMDGNNGRNTYQWFEFNDKTITTLENIDRISKEDANFTSYIMVYINKTYNSPNINTPLSSYINEKLQHLFNNEELILLISVYDPIINTNV